MFLFTLRSMASSVKEIQSVRNACRVLEFIASRQPVGVSDIARATGIDKSAVHRLAVTLNGAGWLDRTAEARWTISPMLSGTFSKSATHSLTEAARPLLEHARDQTGETAMLVIPDGERLLIAAIAESHHTLRVSVRAGVEMPARSSSALRILAAHASPADLAVYRQVDPELTENALGAARERGWAVNDAELSDDTRAVGAALLGAEGKPVGALVLCGPTTRFTRRDIEPFGKLVATLAAGWAAKS
ncbi:hypothetical protein C3469_01735 [Mycobacterium kansasii]|uniref:Acetate operon repressor n=4 Tax=Mycobacterium kansasii TaxID=1768 RepID=A0A653F479_MYCKA|nr:helix-turn-helix domain-containing protein [Mycobacterium kansasii]POX75709.1 hypothetical protein C3475_01435 [Mycobacterium kansasii]POX83545.1 hypothetical protein C3471_00135 [Mycobacterium kansasii]POX86743.1 hypothetical protein C3470_01600 [Mycobacterium kansasii]POX97383.1 hypothetical protein C3473_01720 [Mycobacterium kansasii]